MTKKKILGISVLLFILSIVFYFVNQTEEEAENITSFKISGKEFTLPSPIHSFLYLSNIGFNYKGLIEWEERKPYAYNSQIALHLGLRASDGVVLLFNNDFSSAWKAREDVMYFSDKLGIGDNLKSSIVKLDTTYLKGGSKEDLIEAILQIEINLENSLRKKGRDDLSVLIELGSWMGGLDLVCRGIERDYKESYLQVLHQAHISSMSIEIIKEILLKTENPKEKEFLQGFLDYLIKIDNLIDKFDQNGITKSSLNELFVLAEGTRDYLENFK